MSVEGLREAQAHFEPYVDALALVDMDKDGLVCHGIAPARRVRRPPLPSPDVRRRGSLTAAILAQKQAQSR
jgi:hypothetical protein